MIIRVFGSYIYPQLSALTANPVDCCNVAKGFVNSMKQLLVVSTILLILTLIGCSSNQQASNLQQPWTIEEVLHAFDLTELGSLQLSEDGTEMLLGGRSVPEEIVPFLPKSYGRSGNLLRLDDDVLLKLSPEVWQFVMFASADELRAAMAEYGVTREMLSDIWNINERVSLNMLHDFALTLNTSPSLQTSSGNAGDKLLQALGLATKED